MTDDKKWLELTDGLDPDYVRKVCDRSGKEARCFTRVDQLLRHANLPSVFQYGLYKRVGDDAKRRANPIVYAVFCEASEDAEGVTAFLPEGCVLEPLDDNSHPMHVEPLMEITVESSDRVVGAREASTDSGLYIVVTATEHPGEPYRKAEAFNKHWTIENVDEAVAEVIEAVRGIYHDRSLFVENSASKTFDGGGDDEDRSSTAGAWCYFGKDKTKRKKRQLMEIMWLTELDLEGDKAKRVGIDELIHVYGRMKFFVIYNLYAGGVVGAIIGANVW